VISNSSEFRSAVKSTDRSVVVSCLLGFSGLGTGLSGIPADGSAPVMPLAGLPVRERNERPTQALAAAAAQAKAYAVVGTGAEFRKQATHHRMMWAFRGLEPWRDPA
jgi:hypothetical protein